MFILIHEGCKFMHFAVCLGLDMTKMFIFRVQKYCYYLSFCSLNDFFIVSGTL